MNRGAIASRIPLAIGLGRLEAAGAIGVSATHFDKLVSDGAMPKPRLAGGRKIWSVDELRAALHALPREGEARASSWADVA